MPTYETTIRVVSVAHLTVNEACDIDALSWKHNVQCVLIDSRSGEPIEIDGTHLLSFEVESVPSVLDLKMITREDLIL